MQPPAPPGTQGDLCKDQAKIKAPVLVLPHFGVGSSVQLMCSSICLQQQFGVKTPPLLHSPANVTVGFFAVCQALVVPREVSSRAGETLSLRCWYPPGYEAYNKYWCRGASRDSCHKVVETVGREAPRQRGRVSIQDIHVFCVVLLTVEDISEADAGSYWCGVERMGRDLMEPVTVRVVPALSATLAAPPATPTPWISTTATEHLPTNNATAVGPGGPALSALVPSAVLLSLLAAAGSAGLLCTLRRR
ncbi:CMRF35-like molecule 5, partial [Spheniscus humboldti]